MEFIVCTWCAAATYMFRDITYQYQFMDMSMYACSEDHYGTPVGEALMMIMPANVVCTSTHTAYLALKVQ